MIHVSLRRPMAGLLVSLLLFSKAAPAKNSEQKIATLVEVYTLPSCSGLDCPPWPVPPDGGFCFQVGDAFYTGMSHQWGVPWATKAKRLMALKGQMVEIFVTEKQIIVVAPRIKLSLYRTHQDSRFKVAACAQV